MRTSGTTPPCWTSDSAGSAHHKTPIVVDLNPAELRFANYLEEHGYAWSHEPDYETELGLAAPVLTRPDFLIARDGCRAVAEVRQFETTWLRDAFAKVGGGYMSTGSKEVYGPLRLGLIEKANQLRPFADAGLPLLIVVANPIGADVMLDDHHVMAAMFGNPGFVIPIDPRIGGAPEGAEMHWRLQDYGVFRSPLFEGGEIRDWVNRNAHVSAVVVAHEREHSVDWREKILSRHRATDRTIDAASVAALEAFREIDAAIARGEEPVGSYRWVTVYEVDSHEAQPLPDQWFAGARDERYGFLSNGDYGRLE
jgi:hypothetical protein